MTARLLATAVNPIEGGSCNAYDYVCGDSINNLDVAGTWCVVHNSHGGCKGSGFAKKVGRKNWGDLAAGEINLVWGSYKLASGVVIIALSPGCLAGAPICAAYGAYQVGTGALRLKNGSRQIARGMRNCRRHCSTRNQLEHLGEDLLPGGEFGRQHADPDVRGSG